MKTSRIAERIARAADPSDDEFRLLVSSVTDYAIYLIDAAGRVASWNAGAERIKGYRAAEIVGRHFSLFYPPEERAAGAPERALGAAAREGRFEGEGWRVCKDGSRFWAEVVITALRNPDGTLKGYAKVTRDMTLRHAEREREQLFAATFNHAPHGIAIVDRDGRYLGANASFLALLGYTEGELRAKTVFEVTHPDDVRESRRLFDDALRGGARRLELEKRYVRKHGGEIWAHLSVAPIADREGAAMRFVVQVEDITERRAVQARLRESERRFRLLVSSVTDYAIYVLSPQGEISSWNAGAERIKGYAEREVLGRHFSIFFTAEERAAGKPQRALDTVRASGRFADEGWRLRKDGSRFWALAALEAMRDEAGTLIGIVNVTRDLSERRTADERMRQAQALIEAFTDNSPSAMSLKDRDGRYRFANLRLLARHGLRREQVIGRHDAEIFSARQAAAMSLHDAEVLMRGEPVQYEERVEIAGTTYVSLVVKFAAAGGVGMIAGDITDRRLTEQALREQRALLAEAQKLAGLGWWEWSPDSGQVAWSDELYRIYGLSRDTFKPGVDAYLERVHPEDREHAAALMARALTHGRGFTKHERIVRPGGEVRYLRTQVEVVRDEAGKPIKVLGASLDFTEQRHSETALRQAAHDLHGLTRRLVQAEEAERKRIARELHDRVGQALSALNINLDIVLRSAELAPGARQRLADSVSLVDSTLQSIEGVMAELRPPLLDEYGLAAALAWHAQEFSRRTGIRVSIDDEAAEAVRGLRLEAALALFRIAQEALTNVLKHARAKAVRVEVALAGDEVVMSIQDDGAGFDASRAPRGRLGMTTMRERAEAAGGRLEIDSAPGRGTRVLASVPL
jgi:PAS domain S-box-containing protein